MGDGEEDLISALHDDLLGKIISRLLVKDAARTAVLASRWRHVWRSTPLVLYDGDLPDPTRAATVTRVLADHPGPFRVVLIQNCRLASHSPELAEWPRLLAAKAVETLLFAYQKPAGEAQGLPRIPADIFRCASLKQLFLNCWTWTIPPDHLSRSRSLVLFPQLLLLTLTNIAISDQDLDHLLAASPVLENIILACPLKRLHLRSQSLRSVLVSLLDEFAVVEAPLLDRLFFARPPAYIIGAADPVRLRIASTSNLRVLGYINPMVHKLHINGNIIKPDTMASPSTVVPGIQILALNVNFCDLEEVKMAASLLRCFPNTCTLHIQSVMPRDPSEPTGEEHHAKFWQEATPVECLRSHVKRLVFHKFRGHRNEFEFLKSVARGAKALQSLLLVPSKEKVLSADEVNGMIDGLGCPSFRAWTSKVLMVSRAVDKDWYPMRASDITVVDPFL